MPVPKRKDASAKTVKRMQAESETEPERDEEGFRKIGEEACKHYDELGKFISGGGLGLLITLAASNRIPPGPPACFFLAAVVFFSGSLMLNLVSARVVIQYVFCEPRKAIPPKPENLYAYLDVAELTTLLLGVLAALLFTFTIV